MFIAMGEAHQVRFESERIQLINIMREPAGEAYELASPGPYSVRLFRSPQEEIPDEPLEAFRKFERFVIPDLEIEMSGGGNRLPPLRCSTSSSRRRRLRPGCGRH